MMIKNVIDIYKTSIWLLGDDFHRENEPAILYTDEFHREWWQHGRCVKIVDRLSPS